MKLRSKLNRILIILFLLISIVSYAAINIIQKQRMETMVEKINVLLDSIAVSNNNILANELFEERYKAITIRLNSITAIQGIANAYIFDMGHNQILAANQKTRLPKFQAKYFDEKSSKHWLDKDTLYFLTPVHAYNETFGYLLLEAPLRKVKQEEFGHLFLLITGFFISLTAVLIIINIWVRSSILKPINRLNQGMIELKKGQPGSQIKQQSDDEIGKLSETFNEMSLEISRGYASLQDANELVEQIIDAVAPVFIAIDSNKKVTVWNQAAAEWTLKGKQEAKTQNIFDVFQDLQPYAADIERAIKRWEPVSLYRKNVKESTCNIFIYPLLETDHVGAVIKIDDITEQVQMEELMVQSEKMMSVGSLAAGMAHEINNPLGIILGLTQNLERRCSISLKTNIETAEKLGINLKQVETYMMERGIKSYIQGIKEAGTRAAEIVRSMLDFSRKSSSAPIETDINSILDTTIDLADKDYDLKQNFDFKSINIIRNYNNNLPEIKIFPTQIKQVFLNLVKNAAQALNEKQFSATEEPQITISTATDNRWIRIEIADNGTGMDPEISKRIFEPFFTTKEVGKGTGLGLSVSYFIIKNTHNGDFTVQSVAGKGTKFTILLPINP